jgi:hypothetical protein
MSMFVQEAISVWEYAEKRVPYWRTQGIESVTFVST